MAAPQGTPREPRPQAVLTVVSSTWLSPNMVRIAAGGPGFGQLRLNEFTDRYVKLIFADPALRLAPPYDLAALRAQGQDGSGRAPVDVRTYTVRFVDAEHQRIDIDFVLHGTQSDAGIAAQWAATARPGDTLVATGCGGAYTPDPADDWHLFLGDESAMPAMAAALEALPEQARGTVYLEAREADQIHLERPAGVRIVRLNREEPGTVPTLLADTLADAPWPDGRVAVFAHGERESMKSIRMVLKNRDQRGGQLSISGYWAYGRDEDRFQAEKREPVGKI